MGKRWQLQIVFWLNLENDIQSMLADYIADLKEQRMFAPSMRSALLLLKDLRSGSICELKRQFPDVIEYIKSDSGDTGSNSQAQGG